MTAAVGVTTLLLDGGTAQVPAAVVRSDLLWTAIALVVVSTLFVYRAAVGPTIQDRVVAINAVGTTTVVVIALLAAATAVPGLLDVAMVYAMLNFLLSLGVARFTVERGDVP